jgi:preprotein translocase subunit SecD
MLPLTQIVCVLLAGPTCGPQAAAEKSDKQDKRPRVRLELRRAEEEPAEGLTEATVERTKKKVYLHKKADATNEDVAGARVLQDAKQRLSIEITFTEAGAKKMARVCEEHQKRPLAIIADGKVITAPIVYSKFSKRVEISGEFTKEAAERIVKAINGK